MAIRRLLAFALVIAALLAVAPVTRGQSPGWQWVQNSPLIFCSPGPRSACTPGLGNIVPTVAGSIWIVYTQTGIGCGTGCLQPDHDTIASVTGGGGTWVHCPSCAISNPSGLSADAFYNLSGNAGTTNITITMTATSGSVYGATFIELLPPPGATASFDTSGAVAPSNCTVCTGVSLNLTGGMDVIFSNTGGSNQNGWNSWSAPYITDANGGGTYLNATTGAAPTVTYFANSNPEIFAIAFKSSAGTYTPNVPQYSVIDFLAPNLTSACGTSPACTFTLPLTVGAGHLLYINSGSEIGSFISAVSDNSTGGSNTWTIPAACRVQQTVQSQNNAASCAYVLNSKGGATTVTITMTGNGSTGFAFWEVAATTGTFALDVLGTTLNTPNSSCGGFCFPGQPLAIKGANDVIFQLAWAVGGSLGPNFYPMPHIRNQGGGTGIGVGPANYFFAANVASVVLTDSGPNPPTLTWINPVNNQNTFVIGAAFTVNKAVNAADCNSASVQTALNSVAADGTIVVVPGGSCTWASTVSYTSNFNTAIQGATSVVGNCAPGGACIAADNTTITNSTGSAALHVTSVNGKSIRVSGLTFAQGTGAQEFVGNLFVDGGSQSVRVDHNHFLHANIVDFTAQSNSTAGNLLGVADHNMFNLGGSNEDAIRVEHYNWNGSANMVGYGQGGGEGSWTDAAHWGSNEFFFVENNWFAFDGANTTHAFAFDIDAGGGRVVFRFNNVTPNLALQTHGTGSGDANFRGSRAIEMYGNNFAYVSTTNTFQAFEWESGNAYIWNNTWSNYTQFVQFDYVRTTNATYSQSATPNGWGYCLASPLAGVPGPSPWDVSGSGPCVDQTGRGAGDLIHGTFPSKLNTRTNSITWPNQASEPSYLWANTLTAVPHYIIHFASSNINANADYYTEIPNIDQAGTFNGTQGIGCGPSAGVGCSNPVARPATCSPTVGYWDVNQQGLFTCTSANTWTLSYTPFTYPHPLTTSGQVVPAASFAPTSIAFPAVTVSQSSASVAVVLTNSGTGTMNISSIGFSGANPGDFSQTNNCGSTLGAGANCTINVTFSPTAGAARSGNLSVVSNTPTSPDLVPLTGTGSVQIITGNTTINGNVLIKVNP